jgi:replicative DNA helicase
MKKSRTKPQNFPKLDKVPPQNIEAEASLLSAILIDNRILDDVVDVLAPSDFYRSAHQIIFGAMVELAEKNEPIDLVTLANVLKDREKLEPIGGAIYLAKLIDEVPLAVNAEYYAKIIHDKATLRRLIEKGYAIIKSCFGEQEHVDEIIDFAEGCIFEVSEKKTKPSFFEVKDLLISGFDTLKECEDNKGIPTGVPTGFKQLDNLTSGFQNSDLIILAARPSMGKTAFALNITRNAAVDANIPVASVSLEMAKEQLVMRLLFSELQIPVIALSQLNRQLEKRDDKRPRLSDLRESGSLEQDADVVAFIHREEVFKKKEDKIPFEGKAELIVAKQRNGPTDSLPLAFLKTYSRFENLALEDY